MKKNTKKKIALLSIIAVIILCYLVIPSFKAGINKAISVLGSFNIDATIEYIRGYGAYAAVISFLLMILQSVLAPIPAFLITFSNAIIFGWVKGAILSWSSAMAGAAICFYISRILGRDVAEKLTSKKALQATDRFFKYYGKYTILICRLLPFVSFDLVSYAAGLTAISFWGFFIATGIGQLPATIVYSYLGGNLTGSVKTVVTSLLLLFSLTVLIYLFKRIYDDKKAKTDSVK